MSTSLYLQIPEIRGTSAKTALPDAIDVESFAFGTRQKLMALSQGLNEFVETAPSAADMTVIRAIDSVSDTLVAAAAQGRIFPKATLTAQYSGSGEVRNRSIVITMSGMQFTSYQSGGSNPRQESLTLGFQNIHIAMR